MGTKVKLNLHELPRTCEVEQDDTGHVRVLRAWDDKGVEIVHTAYIIESFYQKSLQQALREATAMNQQRFDRAQANWDALEPSGYWDDDPRRDDAEAEEAWLVTQAEAPLMTPRAEKQLEVRQTGEAQARMAEIRRLQAEINEDLPKLLASQAVAAAYEVTR